MQKKNTSLEQCLKDERWYTCPVPLVIFVIFFLLFLYSCFVLIKCGDLIKAAEELGSDDFERKYGKKLKDATTLYVINLVVCVLCVLVLAFFLYKALPVSAQAGLFNQYLGGSIVLFVFITTILTLGFFNTVHAPGKSKTTIGLTATVMVFSLIAILLYGRNIYLFLRKPRGDRVVPAA